MTDVVFGRWSHPPEDFDSGVCAGQTPTKQAIQGLKATLLKQVLGTDKRDAVIRAFLRHPKCDMKSVRKYLNRMTDKGRWQLAKGKLGEWSPKGQKRRRKQDIKRKAAEKKRLFLAGKDRTAQKLFERGLMQGGLCSPR